MPEAHKLSARIIPRANENLEETKINNPKSSTNYEKRFKFRTLQGIQLRSNDSPSYKQEFSKD
jgi:hypothetical protein